MSYFLHFGLCIFSSWMKKPSNAIILQCVDTRNSPTCFGTSKCHHQGVNHDPAEISAQCSNLNGMLKYIIKNHKMYFNPPFRFLQHWAFISAGSWLIPWWWHFKVPKHVGECRVSIHWRIAAFVGFFHSPFSVVLQIDASIMLWRIFECSLGDFCVL
jgi:hypothetical protein